MPFLARLPGLQQLLDVLAGIAQRDELAAVGSTTGSSKRADHGTTVHTAGRQRSPAPRSISSTAVRQVLSFIR
jgi:hypothetical protein